jgi:UDP-N-acetylmuramoyl-L-alanyl-D-glutamate--2,6-diaminopimelate ligase
MTIAARLAAADAWARPRPLAELVERLRAEGRLRGEVAAPEPGGVRAPDPLLTAPPTDDSRAARPGSLFVAIVGAHADGHDHLREAADAGAVAALVERSVAAAPIPCLVVERSRAALASAAAWWYGDPSRELAVVGVTGTDGKTTTSFLAVAALEAAGLRAGLVGTVETAVGNLRERNPEHVTTPSAPELQRLLRAMVLAGDDVAVIETTSHGLALDRVAGIAYDAAVLTNLSHEHLELHGGFEAYRAAKRLLFERLGSGGPKRLAGSLGRALQTPLAVINADDQAGSEFAAAATAAGARVVRYGAGPEADVRATAVDEDPRRLRVAYVAPSGPASVDLRLAGRFNAENALAVLALGEGLGLDPIAVRAGLAGLPSVPGRMERIEAGQPFAVVVDYAHSPASLEKVLGLLAPIAAAAGGALIAVFGSAGERDTAKRPMMGRIAGERCRLVVVTDEDPRGEDPRTILEAISLGAEAAGRRRGEDLLLIADRAAAIRAALGRAEPGDVVLLAGKGHEQSIIGATGPVPWDEAAAARTALADLGWLGPRSADAGMPTSREA